MLLEIAIADASLAPFEFKDAAARARFTPDRYHTPDGVGRYTDDTQMSLAVCEHMLAGRPNTQAAWAASFMEAYRRDPRAGYAKRVVAALSSPDPETMLAAVGAAGDRRGNGPVMRAVPLGMLADPEEVVATCTVQSTATHASANAATAACCVALASHYIYHRWKTVYDMFYFLEGRLAGSAHMMHRAWKDGTEVPCDAMQTASYCIKTAGHALEKGLPPEWLAIEAAAVGGDADSTAAVSVGLHSMREREPDHPDTAVSPGRLILGLEDRPYGRTHLEGVDARMAAAFPRNGR